MTIPDDIPWLAEADRSSRYLVGVSGGADSVALLHRLVDAGFHDLVVCHLDHRLRGGASTADARFVIRLAGKLGLPCECGRIDVRAEMKLRGESMETAARNARHRFFAGCSRKFDCRSMLLAHHADDQAETVLWNLLRGSHGLKGMRAEQPITVEGVELTLIRPLLGTRRVDLSDWLRSHGHTWREDASNREPVAVRNRLRNEVFPLLAEITGRDAVPAFVRAAADAAGRDAAESGLLEHARLLDPQGRIHLPTLRKLPLSLQRTALRDFLADAGIPSIDRALLDRAAALAEIGREACVNLPGGGRLRRTAGRIWIEPAGQR